MTGGLVSSHASVQPPALIAFDATVDDPHTTSGHSGDIGIVGYQDDRLPRPMQIFEDRHDLPTRGAVEVAGGLVRQQQGRVDHPLDDLGHRQAEAAASSLVDAAVGVVVASPLRRAVETAEKSASATGSELRIDDKEVRLLAIKHGQSVSLNTSPDQRLRRNDHLVLVGEEEALRHFSENL